MINHLRTLVYHASSDSYLLRETSSWSWLLLKTSVILSGSRLSDMPFVLNCFLRYISQTQVVYPQFVYSEALSIR